MGTEAVVLDSQTGELVDVRHSGRGTAVAGGEFDAGNAAALSGAWYLERTGFVQPDPPAMPMHIAFVHSPYSRFPLAPDEVGATRQYVFDGSGLRWQGEPHKARILLR